MSQSLEFENRQDGFAFESEARSTTSSSSTSQTVPVFKKRSGTTDVGKSYEDLYMAYILLKLTLDGNVEDFNLSSNDASFGSFDDVVIEVKFYGTNERVIYAMQLKHKISRRLQMNALTAAKGDFSLVKYLNDVNRIKCNSNVRWVLFTNCKELINNDSFICYNSQSDEEINIQAFKEENHALSTSKESNLFRFKADKHSNFFHNFMLFTDQKNVDQLKQHIMDLFHRELDCGEDSFKKYYDIVTAWSLQEGKKLKLNKQRTKKILFLCAVFPLLKPLEFSKKKTINENKAKIIQRAIALNDKMYVTIEDYEILKYLWFDCVDPENVPQMNRINREYFVTSEPLHDLSRKNKELNQLLWVLGKCPLIVESAPQVHLAIEAFNENKLIILDDNRQRKECSSFLTSLADLRSEKDLYQNILNNFAYAIDGQKETLLKDLIETDENLDRGITIQELIKMTDGPYQIVNKDEWQLPPCHIKRSVTRNLLQFQFLENLKENTVVIVACKESKNLKEKYPNLKFAEMESVDTETSESTIFISEDELSEQEFSHFCGKNPKKKVHYFRYCDKNRLEWIQSKNMENSEACSDDLRPFRLEEIDSDSFISETQIFDRIETHVNIVCANPGMGKSTLAKSLKQNSDSNFWTLIIQARNYSQNLEKYETDPKQFFMSVLSDTCTEYHKKIFSLFFENGKFRIIWDGLDEISGKKLEKVLSMVKDIRSRYGFKQWLTSRQNLKTKLEKEFDTFARDLKQFDEADQETYIRGRLESVENLSKIIDKIKQNIQKFSNNNILGIPLQIFMLTELLLTDKVRYSKLLENTFSVLDLYEHFVTEKFNLQFKEKQNVNLNIDENFEHCVNEKEKFKTFYSQIARSVYLEDKVTKYFQKFLNLKTKGNSYVQQVKEKGDKFGFISVTEKDHVEFTHNSYGEYFAALYLFEHNKKIVFKENFISEDNNDNIRFFLDSMLSRNSTAFVAILCQNFSLLEQCSEEELFSKDAIGRDVLCLSCAWNKNHPILQFKGSSLYEYNLKKLNNENTDPLNYEKVKTAFAQIKKIDLKKTRLLLFFPFMIRFFDEHLDDFQAEYLPTILYHAMKLDNSFLYDYIHTSKSLMSKFDHIEPASLLMLGLNFNSRKVLEKIMTIEKFHKILLQNISLGLAPQHAEMFKYLINLPASSGKLTIHYACNSNDKTEIQAIKELILKGSKLNKKDNDGMLPIHYVCDKEDSSPVEWLVNNGSQINVPDNNGELPIHYACKRRNFTIVKILVNKGSKINEPDARGMLPVHYACKDNNLEMVEVFVNKGSDVNSPDKDDKLPIYYACEKYDAKMIRILVNKGSKIDHRDKNGRFPIHYACKSDDFETAQILLEKGTQLNVYDKNGLTPIHYVSKNGNVRMMELLVKKGSDVNSQDSDGMIPLHYACKSGNKEMSTLLLQNGSEVNSADNNKMLPIHYACEYADSGVLQLLLEKKSEINCKDSNLMLPIHHACKINDISMVELLVKNGTQVNILDKDGMLPIHYACKNGSTEILRLLLTKDSEVNTVNNNDELPIHYACENGNTEMYQLLIEKESKTNVRNKDGAFPIHYACANSKWGNDIVKLLLQKDELLHAEDSTKSLPIHYACKNGNSKTVKLLLSQGSQLNCKDANGMLPIHYACEKFKFETVKLLVDRGSEINVPDKHNRLPIYYACIKANFDLVKVLTQKGSEINVSDQDKTLPIHYACKDLNFDTAKLLLDSGSNVNDPDEAGMLPIHYACKNKSIKMVQLLIDKGSHVNIPDKDGLLPIHYACEANQKAIAELLVNNGSKTDVADENGRFPTGTGPDIIKVKIKL